MKTVRHYEFPEDESSDADEALWFANSKRAALESSEQSARKQRQVDRLVNWGFTALIVGFGIWAGFA